MGARGWKGSYRDGCGSLGNGVGKKEEGNWVLEKITSKVKTYWPVWIRATRGIIQLIYVAGERYPDNSFGLWQGGVPLNQIEKVVEEPKCGGVTARSM